MKKLMLALATLTCAFGLNAETLVITKDIDVTASHLVYTNIVKLADLGYKDVVKLTFKNDTAVTATTVTAMEDVGVWTTISTDAVSTGATSVTYPTRSVTEVATGGYYETNDVLVATTITNTKKATYPAQKLRFITTLSGTNGVATADAVRISVYAEDK